MRVLVTGAAGYIGSRLVAHLARAGAEVVAFDRFDFGAEGLTSLREFPELRLVKGDVRDRHQVETAMHGCDAVIMLAAVVGEPACNADPASAEQINRDAAIAAIGLAQTLGVKRFIFFSTCSNYGLLDPSQLADEETPLHPLSLYASTKVDVERFALSASGAMTITVLRLGTICGLSGRMRFDLLVNDMARAAALGQTIEIYRPNAWRPFLHVADAGRVVECVLGAPAERVNRRVFNVVGGNYQKAGLADIARKHFPDVRIVVTNSQPDKRDYRVSGERIERELGFKTAHTIEEAFLEVAAAVSDGVFVDPMWPGYCATPLRLQSREVAV
jgi:nucleoside-diphosphate-sugar epimerase